MISTAEKIAGSSELLGGSAAYGLLWILIASILVVLLQPGFMLLEVGNIRAKNTMNAAQKMLIAILIGSSFYLLFSTGLIFGSGNEALSASNVLSSETARITLLYQMATCLIIPAILSGAVTERMSIRAFMAYAAFIVGCGYPLFGLLIDGSSHGEQTGVLVALGFVDRAGVASIHIMAAGAGLAALMMLGPRAGRFADNGKINPMPGQSSVTALMGAMLLVVGWFGVNGGAATLAGYDMSIANVNTAIAVACGGTLILVLGAALPVAGLDPRMAITGSIGALVASSAGVTHLDTTGALIIGVIGALSATIGSKVLLLRARMDDPLDVVACHGFAGIAGVIAVGFLAMPESFDGDRLSFITTQTFGALLAGLWGFATALAFLWALSRVMALRITPHHEEVGFNIMGHGEILDLDLLIDTVTADPGDTASTAQSVHTPAGEAADTIADVHILDRVLKATERARTALTQERSRSLDFERVGNDWLFEIDADNAISYVSERFHHVFGDQADRLIGQQYLSILEEVDYHVEEHARDLERRQPFNDVIFAVMGYDAKKRFFSISGLPRFDQSNQFLGFRARATDITEVIKAQDEIRYMAMHDHLTGLANRVAFQKQAQSQLVQARMRDQACALIAIDLSGFKLINQNFGHLVGDDLLRIVAQRISIALETSAGDKAICARYGSDEFVAMISASCEDIATVSGNASAQIVAALSEPIKLDALDVTIASCIGIAYFPGHAETYKELLRYANMALSVAKKTGSNTITIFDEIMAKRIKRRKKLELDMQRALRDRELTLLYQPQVSIAEQKLTGFEALVRWNHPELGMLSPLEFISIAEESGQIVALGEYVLREACHAAALWPKLDGKPLSISVNVSPLQFFRNDLTKTIAQVLAETGIPPSQLEIEITEGTLVRDADKAVSILSEIRQMGVRIAVDDFGTGYSSLHYLQRFPIDRLKIDRAFVKDLTCEENNQRITNAIVQLGKILHLNVIAEGVETPGQLVLLSQMNCDEVQGYLYAKPLEPLRALALIATNIENGYLDFDPLAAPQPVSHQKQA